MNAVEADIQVFGEVTFEYYPCMSHSDKTVYIYNTRAFVALKGYDEPITVIAYDVNFDDILRATLQAIVERAISYETTKYGVYP